MPTRIETGIDFEEDQIPFDQLPVWGDQGPPVYLGAGIAGQFDADGVAEHFTGEGGAPMPLAAAPMR